MPDNSNTVAPVDQESQTVPDSSKKLATVDASINAPVDVLVDQESTTEAPNDNQQSEKSFIFRTFINDKIFWGAIAVLLLANIGLHQNIFTGRWFGFMLASYSAVCNDSIQTLGTFIASNTGIVAWWKQWLWISAIFLGTTLFSYYKYDGDISYQRLKSKGFEEAPESFNYLQIASAIILLILTRLKVPVSTTFMILTSFVATPKALGATIQKSVIGYALSFGLATLVWLPFSHFIKEYCDKTRGKLSAVWRYAQWACTGTLWSVWLMQDMSTIAVFLPRSLSTTEIIFVCSNIVAGLGFILFRGGEKIQQVVEEKSRIKDLPEATMVDLLYAIILFVFKIASKIPMSTTWCFVGLLAGREISIAFRKAGSKTLMAAFKMSATDLAKVTFGFLISIVVGCGANEKVRQSIVDMFKKDL